MQFFDGRLIVSPSDLTGFLECEHLTQQELAAARGEIERPERKDPELEVLTQRGLEHEARHLVELRTSRQKVIEFPFPDGSISGLTQAHEQTVAAMREGVDVIYQGTFFDGRWRCHPDFLLKGDKPSKLGYYSCLVAGMRRDQTRRLNLAGIKTVTELGVSPADQPIQGINEMALARLRQQARLQVEQRRTESLPFEVLPPLGEHLGFQALPAPTPNDLFFDMEGDPFVGDNGLEYLFGILEIVEGSPRHHAFWGHNPDEEKRAFEQAVDLLIERLDRDPDLHVYHYAANDPK